LALIANDLAEEEIERLDPGRTLVDAVDLGVAQVLPDRIVIGVARPPNTCNDRASNS
jgi:hypothetical protein